jgi:hypothetical protein
MLRCSLNAYDQKNLMSYLFLVVCVF